MNLQSKKVRIPLAALGTSALVCGMGAVVASPAFAAGETLSFLGATGNSATIVAKNTVMGGAPTSFGVKVSGQTAGDSRPLEAEVISAPTGGNLRVINASGNAAPGVNTSATYANGDPTVTVDTGLDVAAGDTVYNALGETVGVVATGGYNTGTGVITLDANATGTSQTADAIYISKPAVNVSQSTTGTELTNYAIGDNLYFGTGTAGTYTMRLFRDTNGDDVYTAAIDDATPVFTVTAKAAADAFTLNTPSTVLAGTTGSMAKVSTTVSTTDIRGGSPATLASNVAGALDFAFTDNGSGGGGVTNENTDGAGTYTSADGIFRYLSSTAGADALGQDAGTPHTLSTQLSFFGSDVGTAKTTEITTNGVATLTNAVAAGQADNVVVSGGAVTVRPGTSTVNYTATAKDNATPAKGVSGVSVTFTLAGTSGIALADLTANGAAVPTDGKVTVTTDADGVAKLAVTSAKTADTNAYTVAATSGSATGSPALTTTYTTAAVDQVKVTSTAAQLTPAVGSTSVMVDGKLVDQYGVDFQPSASASQQVAVTGDATGNAVITGGKFSYTFTPTGTPAAGDTNSLTFTYGAKTATATIQWASSAAAAKITLSAPADGAKDLTIQTNASPDPTQVTAFGNTTGQIAGTVLDAADAPLAYKAVTLSGGHGVWFSTSATPDADHPLMEELEVVTNSSGVLSGAYVYFAKSGEHKVMATSGPASATSTVEVAAPGTGAGYLVSVDDIAGAPGSTLIVTGKLVDVFGNAVPGATVDLSTGASTVGALGSTSVTTNSAGVFSTTFTSGSNSSGDVELTATINGLTSDPTPNAALVTAGLELADGDYMATGMIHVAEATLDIMSSANETAGGHGAMADLSGTYLPETSVDIWAKPMGERSFQLVDTVMTDAEGEWGTTSMINRTTWFIAKANGMSSASTKTTVWSRVKMRAKALGHRKVWLLANGDPNVAGKLSFYMPRKGKDKLLKRITSSDTGVGAVTVRLAKGLRSVYVVYNAPGTEKSKAMIKLRVK